MQNLMHIKTQYTGTHPLKCIKHVKMVEIGLILANFTIPPTIRNGSDLNTVCFLLLEVLYLFRGCSSSSSSSSGYIHFFTISVTGSPFFPMRTVYWIWRLHLENHLTSLFVGRDNVLDWLRLGQHGLTFPIISLMCF